MTPKQFISKVLYRIPFYGESFRRLRQYRLLSNVEKSREEKVGIFDKIYSDNSWGSQESFSGTGSQIFTTRKIRKTLPLLWKKLDIKSVLDVPCGDYNWMKEVDKTAISYIGGDIVAAIIENNSKNYSAENVKFVVLDITKDKLPKVDMILCKDCLQHLSDENVRRALVNFKKSGTKYLFTTSYPRTWINWDIADGDYRPLNLRIAPFHLPKPIFKMREYTTRNNEPDKCMYLYELTKIKL